VATEHAPVQRMLESAHNIVIDAALWAGVPFALLLVLAVGAWLAWRGRTCRCTDDWAVLAAVGAMLTHAMLELPLEHAYFLLPLGLLIGSFRCSSKPAAKRIWRWPLAGSVLAMTGLLFVIGGEYLRVEQANRDVRLALFGVGDPSSVAAAPPDVLLLDAPREYHRLMLTPARVGMSPDELDWMQRVTERHAFPPAMMRFAVAAGLNDRKPAAALTLMRLCSMHPPPRCDEGRQAWQAAQQRWPTLMDVPLPQP